jgi:response regulator RpfG family c-di-GMP phosphodiesterase
MKAKKTIKIMVMEDNELYNSLLTRKLKLYTDSLTLETNLKFEINSYVSLPECLRSLKEDIDIIFMDYYLVKNITALDVYKKVKEVCKNCKLFIISRTNDTTIIREALLKGVDEFIFKDKYALAYSCYLVKRVVYNIV